MIVCSRLRRAWAGNDTDRRSDPSTLESTDPLPAFPSLGLEPIWGSRDRLYAIFRIPMAARRRFAGSMAMWPALRIRLGVEQSKRDALREILRFVHPSPIGESGVRQVYGQCTGVYAHQDVRSVGTVLGCTSEWTTIEVQREPVWIDPTTPISGRTIHRSAECYPLATAR